jgi:hypothetical protein
MQSEVWSRGKRGSDESLLSREAGSEAIRHTAPKPTLVERHGLEMRDMRQRMDACTAFVLSRSMYAGYPVYRVAWTACITTLPYKLIYYYVKNQFIIWEE